MLQKMVATKEKQQKYLEFLWNPSSFIKLLYYFLLLIIVFSSKTREMT
jgi:hypothetical protein